MADRRRIANPWAGVLVRRDYEILTNIFGFDDLDECRDFVDRQQKEHEERNQ